MKNNNIEFASKWKKLYPDSVTEGQNVAFDIRRKLKKGRSLESAKSGNWLEIDSGKDSSKKAKESLENQIRNSKRKSSFQGLSIKKAPKRQNLLRPANTRSQGNRLVRTNVKNINTRVADIINNTTKGMVGPFQSKVPKKELSAKTKAAVKRVYDKKIDNIVDDFNKAVQAPLKMDIELNEKQSQIVRDKTKSALDAVQPSTNQVLKPKGSNIGLKAAGVVGLTALTVGGGVYLHRKMRSDKGKKRGKYKNFNFPGQLTNF